MSNDLNRWEKTYNNLKKRSWITVLELLRYELEKETQESITMIGPFGLRVEMVMRMGDKSLVLTPHFTDDGKLHLYYDTGEFQNMFSPDSIGAINGMNNVTNRLPDEIQEVIALFK